MSEPFAPDSLGATALRYASKGIKVFPLWWPAGTRCACHDASNCGSPGKHPRTGRGGLHHATTDPRTVTTWWQRWPAANIGLPAGDNDLAVLDIDPAHGGQETLDVLVRWARDKHHTELLDTRAVRTGSGGLHLYYRAPAGGIKTTSRAFGDDAPGVDTRGRGGYVVAPPSAHVSGDRYQLIDPSPLAPWPAILTRLMEPAPPAPAPAPAGPSTPPTTRGAAWAQAALERECEALTALAGAPEGSGKNDRLNAVAYKLGRRVGAGLLDEHHVAESLYAAAARWPGHTDRELRATIRSGLAAGMRNPHTGPARQAVTA